MATVHVAEDPSFLLLLLFQCKHDSERVQIIHVSLHPGFKRDDLFRLLHLNSKSLMDQQTDRQTHRFFTTLPSCVQVSWFPKMTRKEI